MLAVDERNLSKKYDTISTGIVPTNNVQCECHDVKSLLREKNISHENLSTSNHEFEKLTDHIFNKYNIDKSLYFVRRQKCTKYRDDLDDDQFWKNLPNPKETLKTTKFATNIFLKKIPQNPIVNNKVTNNDLFKKQTQKVEKDVSKLDINNEENLISTKKTHLKKYFNIWRKIHLDRKEKIEKLNKQNERRNKVNEFINNMEKVKSGDISPKRPLIQVKCTDQKKLNSDKHNLIKTKNHEDIKANTFSHRFKAQKQIIETQKIKLEEQTKLIQALKMGKLQEELQKSLDSTKINIREIFSKCSAKLKCKVVPLIFDENHKTICKFDLVSSKAPKIIKEMEKRAFERAVKREFILEKKKLLDEERKRIKQLEIDKKVAQDEEQRKKNIEAIKEQRKRDLEKQKIRQKNKEIYFKQLKTAEDFYKIKLLQFCLRRLKILILIKNQNEIKSKDFSRKKMLENTLNTFKIFLNERDREKSEFACDFYRNKLLRKTFRIWYKVYRISIQNMQVAQDYYDYKIQVKMFNVLLDYSCKMYIIHLKNTQKAEKHYKRCLLVHYFYMWKILPAVLRLEKVKEEKKRKWREKVWEILPDYTIPYL